MEIQHTILGLLDVQPLSGYDLKKIMAESDLFYWSGNNNQIYHSLVSLREQGLVTVETILQESLPARKVYSITPAGRAALREAVLVEPPLPEFRDPFLIQLSWGDALHGDELDALLARYAEEIGLQIRMREERMNRTPAMEARSHREALLWTRIAGHNLARYQRELEWVNWVRQELQDMA
jgi:PadR family transcriptional regulator, regulatory protein AphA